MGPLDTEDYAAFAAFARELRAMGAVRVRAGALEAAFASAQQDVPDVTPAQMERVDVTQPERAELQELRELKRRIDELGMDI